MSEKHIDVSDSNLNHHGRRVAKAFERGAATRLRKQKLEDEKEAKKKARIAKEKKIMDDAAVRREAKVKAKRPTKVQILRQRIAEYRVEQRKKRMARFARKQARAQV